MITIYWYKRKSVCANSSKAIKLIRLKLNLIFNNKMCTTCAMFRGPALSYCTWNYKLVQQIKEQFAEEYEVLRNLPGQRWVIAGGFICYLLKLTDTFGDIDIFYFNNEFSERCDKFDWQISSNVHYIFNVFNHRKYNIQVIEFTKITSGISLRDQIFNLLCCFDCVLVRKAIHLKSALFMDCNFGPVKFETTTRQKKYNQRILQPIITQPKSLFLITYEHLHNV